ADILYCGIAGIRKINQIITNNNFRVIKSINGGSSFVDFSEGLPALPVNYLLTIESTNHLIFCATDAGIYYRMDGMTKWECFNNNLPLTPITDLDYNYCSKELFASTYGRGMWKTKVNFTLETNENLLISSNTTWTNPMNINTNIVVTNGAILDILNTTLFLDSERKIIIEPGSKLITNNSTLTNTCNAFWSGIEVYGNYLLAQNSTNQGYVKILNNSVIENASEAVNIWKPGNWATTGGILIASNSLFKNNKRSVEYMPYHHFSLSQPNTEIKNLGRITNCEFIWSDSYVEGKNAPFPAITMYHVNGVQILGCTFSDDRTGILSNLNRAKGIVTIDASFKVLGRNLLFNQPVHTTYNETNYDVGIFRNLYKGIEASNSNSQATITVDHIKFENLLVGVEVRNMDNVIMTRNKFDFTTTHPSDISQMYQSVFNQSSAFKIEGNIYNNQTIATGSVGSLVYDSGPEQNQIYNNTYNQLYTANYAHDYNSDDDILYPSGLQWLCNQHTNSQKYDLYSSVSSNWSPVANGGGVRLKQGSSVTSAQNLFSSTISSGGVANDYHFKSEDMDFVKYYYSSTIFSNPIENSGNITRILANKNSCPTSFTNIIIGSSKVILPEKKVTLLNELNQINTDFVAKKLEFDALLLNGNRIELHNLVANLSNSNKNSVKNVLMNETPYLSETLLRELGQKDVNLFPHPWYMDLIIKNIEVTDNPSFLEFLKTKSNSLPDGLYNQIIQAKSTIISERGLKQEELMNLDSRREEIYNLFILDELNDELEINWVNYNNLVIQRNDAVSKSQLADLYLGKGDYIKTNEKLNEIDANISSFLYERINQEMRDYTLFKRYIMSITENTGIVKNLTDEQIEQLNYMANNFVGKSSGQAQNILCFHKGICKEIEVLYDNEIRSFEIVEESSNDSDLELKDVVTTQKLVIIPNPNRGAFKVKMWGECGVESLKVLDIQGKSIEFNNSTSSTNSVDIELINASEGLYFIIVDCSDGTIQKARVLVK
ncbi:MAG: T9SS type A sorting domain-containing protein, partial [Flavobacteriia bacterium]|nr:T9SS type A sorting domain-containing protein [Flavobacteriia bacterium]